MDALFQKVIDDQEAKAPNKDAYQRIMVAGLKAMFDKSTHAMLMEGMEQAPDVAEWAGKGIAGLLGMLTKQAKGTMPFQEMLMAGVSMLMHALDFLAQAGKVEPSPRTISTAMKAYSSAILSGAGISEEQLMQAGEQANQAIADPAKADLIKKHFAGA